MNPLSRSALRGAWYLTIALGLLLQPLSGTAQLLNLVKSPLFVSPPIPPLVMLDISKDQQLYKKAYNDYSDLDGDGVLETTYKHSIDYYGYFDSFKCYDYGSSTLASGIGNRFIPVAPTSTKYCDGTKWSGNFLNWVSMSRMDAVRKLLFGGARANGGDLATASGYGSVTILERAYLPTDAHSWAKYYNGADINRLTPFNPATTNPSSGVFSSAPCVAINAGTVGPPFGPGGVALIPNGEKQFCNVPTAFITQVALGDQISAKSADGTKVVGGRVTALGRGTGNTLTIQVDGGSTGTGIDLNWDLTNLSTAGISFCNTTLGTGAVANQLSQSNTNPPLMRVVKGNFELWGASEGFQCALREEKFSLQGSANPPKPNSSNGNQAPLSGLNASAENPSRDGYTVNLIATPARGLGITDFIVRIEACNNTFIPAAAGQTTEKCKQYDQAGLYKPIGLLQVYAEDGRILFGLMTGSYMKNTSGGVLRKNISDLSTEVDSSGRFINDPLNGTIIRNLSRMRMYGYDYNGGTYIPQDNCWYQLTSSDLVDGMCRSWGNPMSEIYAESLRYFAGATAPSFLPTPDDTNLFSSRVRTATWPNPNNTLTANNYCTPLNILVFNASVSSKDSDGVVNPFVGNPGTPKDFTDAVGTSEGMPGKSFFVGTVSGSLNNLCDAKPFTTGLQLGSAQGICPEAPSLNGSYLMAGLAHQARINRIRNDLTVPANDTKSLKVTTYGISLATNVPRIEVLVPGSSTGKKVVIQPVYRLVNAGAPFLNNLTINLPDGSTKNFGNRNGKVGSGAIVDVKIVPFIGATACRTGSTCGSMYVNWEDSEQGGDYDQDVWGVVSYDVSATDVKITTKVVSQSTVNPQGFGYVVSGTTQDGPHFHSGINPGAAVGFGFAYQDYNNAGAPNGTLLETSVLNVTPTTKLDARGGCRDCQETDPATTATYTLSTGTSASALEDPLYYAAKYGGFIDSDGNNLPNKVSEWDNFNNTTGAAGPDGIPDNFFFVTNPLGLEKSLDKLFNSILQAAAASAVAANSSKLNTSTRIYQAVFNPSDWSGKMRAFSVDPVTGAPRSDQDWDAAQVSLNGTDVVPDSRVILTFNKGVASGAPQGIKFRWPSDPTTPSTTELSASQITALRLNPTTLAADPLPSPYVAASDPGNMRLEYLRGTGTNEGLFSTSYRRRLTTKLGDIINSNPNFVAPPNAGNAGTSYATFTQDYKNRKPMLYVGANDGMLHGFNACGPTTETNRPSACGSDRLGAELLAYVPSSVYRNLSKLTSRSYSHEYFVDGSPVVADAEFSVRGAASRWRTALVGGLNRGGQGVYALDVTDPSRFTEGNASSLVLWEFTDADDPDLGFTFGTPAIRQMANGKWAAIVSGGYNNTQGTSTDPAEMACASGVGTTASPYLPVGCTISRTGYGTIFILYLDGPDVSTGRWTLGTHYLKLSTDTGSTGTPNGVASPFAAEVTGDGLVDFIYAGDLNGALWKFDVSTTAKLATPVGLKLFDAVDSLGNPQPITASAEATLHPTGVGVMVSFGTGKYLEANDVSPPGAAPKTQTIYGIWDKNVAVSGRSDLMRQRLQPGITVNPLTVTTSTTTGTPPVTTTVTSLVRITTKHQPNYTSAVRPLPPAEETNWDGASGANQINSVAEFINTPANQLGWYLDLFNGPSGTYEVGERIIYSPFVKNGIVFYSSLWPIGTTCLGATAGDNITLMIATGARPDSSVFDINGDQQVNASDMIGTGVFVGGVEVKVAATSRRIEGGSAQPPTLVSKGGVDIGYQNPTSGNLATGVYSFGRGPGRVSWREILY